VTALLTSTSGGGLRFASSSNVLAISGHTAASLAIQAGAHIKSLQNMLGHASASLTLDRYGHLYESDVEAVGVASIPC
jgi:site-specific recombinase XerD